MMTMTDSFINGTTNLLPYTFDNPGLNYSIIRTTFSLLLLIGLLLAAVFFLAAGSFIYFRLYTTLEQTENSLKCSGEWDSLIGNSRKSLTGNSSLNFSFRGVSHFFIVLLRFYPCKLFGMLLLKFQLSKNSLSFLSDFRSCKLYISI